LGVESAVGYISSVANPEDYSMFVVLDIVQAETMGQISRTGFVKGWSQQKVAANPKSHKAHVQRLCKQVVTDPAYFKKLYDLAFRIGKEPQQRALDMESAITFWGVLFEPTMHSWRSPKVNWLEAWSGFLRGKFYVENGNSSRWTRTVSRDLWTQTAAFAARTMEDESLGFWSEEQAWPGLIDEFVVWCREKGIVPGKKEKGMEVDD
ncbi:defective in cullin neddylation protein, partial [Canariomyces notabilis]